MYAADDMLAARRALVAFYQWCAEVEVPEVTRLAKTVSAWEHEVLAYHTTGLSNGPTEAVNLLIEKVRRIGHGFRKLRQLSAPAPSALWGDMADSSRRTNQRPSTRLGRVEPPHHSRRPATFVYRRALEVRTTSRLPAVRQLDHGSMAPAVLRRHACECEGSNPYRRAGRRGVDRRKRGLASAAPRSTENSVPLGRVQRRAGIWCVQRDVPDRLGSWRPACCRLRGTVGAPRKARSMFQSAYRFWKKTYPTEGPGS